LDVVIAAQQNEPEARNALASLCTMYWYPLYSFVRRQGRSPHDAQDLTQEFFARLLEKGWLDGVAREKGKFRSFLLASNEHFWPMNGILPTPRNAAAAITDFT